MKSSVLGRSRCGRPLSAFLAAFAAGAAVAGALVAPAGAADFGQLEQWGVRGTDPGELHNPKLLGADPADGPGGSVYVADAPTSGEMRIQKFTGAGVLKGSVSIPTLDEEGVSRFQGIVVDHSQERIYLLQYKSGADTETGKAAAQKILVFSTVPEAGELVPPPGGPEVLPVPDPTGSTALDNPQDFVLDPTSGDLMISAEDREGHFVLQRIHTAGNGSLGPLYVETGASIDLSEPGIEVATTVGPQGEAIVLKSNSGQSGAESTRAFTLQPDLTGSPVAVPGFAAAAAEEAWNHMEIARPAEGAAALGQQIAVSADGGTLYWKERFSAAASGPTEPGSYLVRGYSLDDRHTAVLYGGEEEEGECTIQTATAALAADGEGVDVLDQGPEAAGEPAYGADFLGFGPGGSGCPAAAASFALMLGAGEVATVQAGTDVTLDASSSELGELGEPSLDALTWKVEGPGGLFEETVPSSDSSPFTLDHVFTQAGQYTVRLQMEVSGAGYPVQGGMVFAAKPRELTVTPIPIPSVTGLAPDHGAAAGGNLVTITGTDLSGATEVDFGANPATEVVVENATTVKAKAPAGVPVTTVDVTVSTPGGTSPTAGSANDYSYDPPPVPTVTGLTPNHGAATGANIVTITGTDLSGATEVDFGANPATEVVVENATTVKAKAPAGVPVTTVDVTVTTPGGTSPTAGSANDYSYDPPPVPTVTGLTPNHGAATGANIVTITGTDLSGATEVDFGANPATEVVVENATTVKAKAPAGAPATTVDVTVTTLGGTSPTAGAGNNYTYVVVVAPVPTVTALNPTHGAAAGGNLVTLTGTNLSGATEVHFGSNSATEVVVQNATTVTVKAPAGTAGAAVDVIATTPGGTSAVTGTSNDYTYDAVLRKLTVTKTGSGFGSVMSLPLGINCGAVCAADFVDGASVTITATPASGSTFAGWSGGVCSGTGACVVAATAAKSVTATFNTNVPPPVIPAPTPTPAPRSPKPIKCKTGFKKQKVKGKAKCVKIKKHGKRGDSGAIELRLTT